MKSFVVLSALLLCAPVAKGLDQDMLAKVGCDCAVSGVCTCGPDCQCTTFVQADVPMYRLTQDTLKVGWKQITPTWCIHEASGRVYCFTTNKTYIAEDCASGACAVTYGSYGLGTATISVGNAGGCASGSCGSSGGGRLFGRRR